MKYFAHSENNNNKKHLLSKHLKDTAMLARSFACQSEFQKIFYLTGLLHDLGKYQPDFQNYLENGGKRGSVPHASWGAGYARRGRLLESSIVIDGHHKGLPDNSAWKNDTEQYKRGDVGGFEEVVKTFISDIGFEESILKAINSLTFDKPFQREAFIRYLFSSLTDSDWLSTEQHFDENISRIRSSRSLPIAEMISKLEKELSCKSTEGKINQIRNDARYQVLQKATLPVGFYSLALPTGMGKTLTSVSWALKHAETNGLKRIIIVLPFVNIIDQTAQILKNIFGDDLVLEHHSAYNESGQYAGDDANEQIVAEKRKNLACENWDYPVVITTTVQFFESLFSNRPSRCRKIHNIAESVVVFDEVQTLPKEIILPTLQMLKDIQFVMKASFLFCTATQPAFEKRQGFEGIDIICPLVDNPAELYKVTQRVEYCLINNLDPIAPATVLEAVIKEDKASLVIFNTKKAALDFYNSTKTLNNWEMKYHLSTAMCPAHRKIAIKNICDDLKTKRKILVASTQLIEAGVDFDFPVVFRAMAPLESIIQAAGRCNRENNLGRLGGRVFIFNMLDGGMPDKTYAACASYTGEIIKPNINLLHDHQIFNKYYAQVLSLYIDPDKYNINTSRSSFNFRSVNDSYFIIRNATEGLYIYNYNEESRQLFNSIEHKEFLSRDDYRKMQMYTVQVYKFFLIQNAEMCKLIPQGFQVWYGNYDHDTGISVEPVEADKMIV